jgi:hypothetical protein
MNADEHEFYSIRVHPRSSAAYFNTPERVKFRENLRFGNGMLVAQWTAIAFVPTKLGRG